MSPASERVARQLMVAAHDAHMRLNAAFYGSPDGLTVLVPASMFDPEPPDDGAGWVVGLPMRAVRDLDAPMIAFPLEIVDVP